MSGANCEHTVSALLVHLSGVIVVTAPLGPGFVEDLYRGLNSGSAAALRARRGAQNGFDSTDFTMRGMKLSWSSS